MQSGLYYGYIGLVDGILERIIKETQGRDAVAPKVIATGGLASLVMAEVSVIDAYEPWLTLIGLRLVYERNAGRPESAGGGGDGRAAAGAARPIAATADHHARPAQ